MWMLESGASIEPGDLTCEIQVEWHKRFSAEKLTGLFGSAWVDDCKAILPSTEMRQLQVFEAFEDEEN